MSKMCKNCRYFATTGSSSVCTLYCCATSDGENCRNYEVSTLFDRITTSPEVLAPNFVVEEIAEYLTAKFVTGYRSTIIPDKIWENYEEAIAATVAKLKEVAE